MTCKQQNLEQQRENELAREKAVAKDRAAALDMLQHAKECSSTQKNQNEHKKNLVRALLTDSWNKQIDERKSVRVKADVEQTSLLIGEHGSRPEGYGVRQKRFGDTVYEDVNYGIRRLGWT